MYVLSNLFTLMKFLQTVKSNLLAFQNKGDVL